MVDTLLDGDTARVGSYGARFAGVVFPGETLQGEHLEGRRRLSGGRQRPRPRRCGRVGGRGTGAGLTADYSEPTLEMVSEATGERQQGQRRICIADPVENTELPAT